MEVLQALLLGIFQGITEFLPVSSSGHLVLAEHYFGLPADQLVAFDAVLHGGTLLSLFIVFWGEIKSFFGVIFAPKKAKKDDKKLLLFVIIATIPAGMCGLLFEDFFTSARVPLLTGLFFLVCAMILIAAETMPKNTKKRMGWFGALLAGVWADLCPVPRDISFGDYHGSGYVCRD